MNPDAPIPLPQSEILKPNPLEDGVFVHGFMGNIPNQATPLNEVLENRNLISPGRRADSWSPEEHARYSHTAPFDKDRICMHVWKPGQVTHQYLFHRPDGYAEYFVAYPISVAEGQIIVSDTAGTAAGDVGIYNSQGVEIPLTNGIVFLTIGELRRSWSSIHAYAERINPQYPQEVIRNQFQIIPRTQDTNELLGIVQKRIEPAKGVNYKFPPLAYGVDDPNEFVQYTATTEDLGQSGLLQGDFIPQKLLAETIANYKEEITNRVARGLELINVDISQWPAIYSETQFERNIEEEKSLLEALQFVDPEKFRELVKIIEASIELHNIFIELEKRKNREATVKNPATGTAGPRIPRPL